MAGSSNEIALAALTVLDAGPARQIEAAAQAGFDFVGLRLNPLLASDPVTIGNAAAEREVRDRLEASGLGVVEIGVVTITPGLDVEALRPLFSFSAGIGARFLVCPVGDADRARRARAFAALCDAAAPWGLVPLVEFNPYSACTSLDAALAMVDDAGRANAGLCIDAFHLSRSGGHPDDLRSVPPALLRLVHLCDAPAPPPEPRSAEAMRSESRGHRLLPGEGALWLGPLMSALPRGIPVSVEAPSASMAGLAPEARARRALAATRRFLAGWAGA